MIQSSATTAPGKKGQRQAHQPQEPYRQIPEDEEQKRQELLKLWLQLETEYTTWRDTHEDIIDFEMPNRGAFWPTDTNRGTRKDVHVVNNTAQDRARKLAAAMDTGITSEAREWFVVGVEDQTQAEDRGVREYLHKLQTALYAFISKVGFYAPNRNVFADLVGPAIGLMLIEEDSKKIARCTHVPIGQYRVWTDSAGEICGVARRFIYTASQMVDEFGEERVSAGVRRAVQAGITQTTKFTVLHIIRERANRDPSKIDSKNKPWESVWLEVGQGYAAASVTGMEQISDPLGPAGILRESGFNECPFYCPRWDSVGQNAYGTDSPGWIVLGDTKSLQDLELGGARTLAQIMDPALNVPSDLKNASILPGARNYLPDNAKVKAEPTVVIPPEAVKVFEMVVQRFESRIDRGMFGDILFLLSADQRVEPKTAEEIRGIKEERLLQLGGVFARVARELRKAIMRLAAIAHRAGLLPEPPPQLAQRGIKLKIEFTNPLVTAQKAIGVSAIGQTISIGLAAAQAKKGGFDSLDVRKTMNVVSDMLGAPPDILFSEEELQKMDQALASRVNQQQQAESLPQAAAAIKNLSQSDPDMLRQLLASFTPQAQAMATA